VVLLRFKRSSLIRETIPANNAGTINKKVSVSRNVYE
jgi:hypothetical protein